MYKTDNAYLIVLFVIVVFLSNSFCFCKYLCTYHTIYVSIYVSMYISNFVYSLLVFVVGSSPQGAWTTVRGEVSRSCAAPRARCCLYGTICKSRTYTFNTGTWQKNTVYKLNTEKRLYNLRSYWFLTGNPCL